MKSVAKKAISTEKGILFVVGTPIGNLEDITLRAVNVLREVDIVLVEDTKRAKILLNHHRIGTKLELYTEYRETSRIEHIIKSIKDGKKVALISNAGMPTIQDPGYRLVRRARNEGINILSVPGPSAVTAALSVSGLPTDRFVFEGFLPRREGKRRSLLESLIRETRTIVIFESVHRIEKTLEEIYEILGDREVSISREMTKMFEETISGRLSALKNSIKTRRGEFVIVIGGSGNEC